MRTRKTETIVKNRLLDRMSVLIATALFALTAASSSLAGDRTVFTAWITGNTVHYQGSYLNSGENYTVVMEGNGNANPYTQKADREGKILGSGTVGKLQIGDTVTLTLIDKDGHPVDGTTATKTGDDTVKDKENKNAPWWAYTVIGTAIYWIFGD